MSSNDNEITLLHLDPWDCFRHIITSFSLDEGGYGLLIFQSNEKILIPLKSKEMADDIQQHLGSVITILRTEDPDNEWLYFFKDDKKEEDIDKLEQNLQPIPTAPITVVINTNDNIKQSEESHVRIYNQTNVNQESDIRRLQLWDEVEGRLRIVSIENGVAKIIFYDKDRVIVPITNYDDKELKKLENAPGKLVSVLCTDIPGKNYLINIYGKKKSTDCLTFFSRNRKGRLEYYLSNIRNVVNTTTNNLPTKDNAPTPFAHSQD